MTRARKTGIGVGAGVVATSAAAIVLATAGVASAASYSYGNYGSLPHEGVYPNGNHACGLDGWVQAVSAQKGTYNGRTYTIRLCYNGSYGAYGRLDGAAINDKHCSVVVDRSNSPHETKTYASVQETVDSGVGYAYTKVANDLSGRLARAALVCDRKAIVRTSWY